MARSSKTDPVRNFKFQVQIAVPQGALATQVGPTIANLGFAVVSGISVTNEMIQYREGGNNTHPYKMIGQSDYPPVTFSKGLFASESALWNWQTFMHSWSQGSVSGGSTSQDSDYRADIIVQVFDHPVSAGPYATPGNTASAPTPAGLPKLAYKLHNCWPASWSLGDLNAGDSSILIQQLVVNHEGFSLFFASDSAGQAPYPGAND